MYSNYNKQRSDRVTLTAVLYQLLSGNLLLLKDLPIVTMYGSTNNVSITNRFPILDILSLMSTDIVESTFVKCPWSRRLLLNHTLSLSLYCKDNNNP
ncbi:MAG: hypothetical protein JO297_10580 [Nitrososphaeraceae archaeon]|nr:hypothetical protein [Nitrososphaeraceae archaeon]